jgi:hypothetical protein
MDIRCLPRSSPVCKLISVLCARHIRSVCASYRLDAPTTIDSIWKRAAGLYRPGRRASALGLRKQNDGTLGGRAHLRSQRTRIVRMRASAWIQLSRQSL